MGDGTKKNPYTREDILKLIEEHGGKADGLDLSNKWFERGINLSELNLAEIVLAYAHLEEASLSDTHLEEADLRGTHLEEAYLREAHLERACLLGTHLKEACLFGTHLEKALLASAHLEELDLVSAHLEECFLADAHLEKASLQHAHFEGAYLDGTIFSADTKLENADWGNYAVGEEKDGDFDSAAATYRRLKIWYTEHGLYNIAGKFFYREMEARRKAQSWKKQPLLKLWNWILRMLCGYGERPERVAISAAAIVFGLAAAYCLWGSFDSSSFGDTLYYSVSSFTALGYGQWAPQPTGWAKGMGAAEAVLGVSMMALFLVTFTRKMIR